MGVFLNTNWRYVNSSGDDTNGWSAPTVDQPLSPLQRIAAGAAEYRAAGFTAILLPPFTKGASGGYSDGYDLFDPYDIGSKNQCGTIPTAFGSAEALRQCIAVIHAFEMQAYGDLVLHQYDGGSAQGVYAYVNYAGTPDTGRWPKTPSCFVGSPPMVMEDAVPDNTGNFAFGLMPSYTNSKPDGYMWNGAIANTGWLTLTTGADGWRIDDVKGTNGSLVYNVLQSGPLSDKWAFGEYYDGNPSALWNWVHGYEQGRAGCLDFAFKFNVGNICNNNSRMWMGQLANIGYCLIDPANAITFVESADTDTSYGEQTVWNKIFGYAIMLTFPGYPMVYYRDWSTDEGCYGLKDQINNLIWIHEYLAQGEFVVRLDTDPQVFVHERMGYDNAPGCVCFFNNDQYNAYTRTVQTHFGVYTQLHEYSGNGSVDDVWTDGYGNLTVSVPRNSNGAGYVIYAPAGVSGGFSRTPVETEQTFFGASDLDIGPIVNSTYTVGRVWCQAQTFLSATLQTDGRQWDDKADVVVEIVEPDDSFTSWSEFNKTNPDEQGFTITTNQSGWHTLRVDGYKVPQSGSSFSLRVNYTAAPI